MRGKWWNLSRTHGAQGLSPEPVSLATEIYCLENGESKGLTVESGDTEKDRGEGDVYVYVDIKA